MALFSFPGKRPANLGVQGARLAPCPASPNCVCSDDTEPRHAVSPFLLVGAAEEAWPAVRAAVTAMPRTSIVEEDAGYLHAECRSAVFGLVDDLELHLRPADGIIAVRSASRLGHSDLGVNRRRVEKLRAELRKRGLIR